MRRIATFSFVLLCATGCRQSHQFELVVIVVNATNGSPVEGVTIHRNMWGERTDPKTAETVFHTDGTGRGTESFPVSDTAFGSGKPTWLLRLSKDGFEPATVEFKPAKAPTVAHTRLEVNVELKPVSH
jgi:hypothetical protein